MITLVELGSGERIYYPVAYDKELCHVCASGKHYMCNGYAHGETATRRLSVQCSCDCDPADHPDPRNAR